MADTTRSILVPAPDIPNSGKESSRGVIETDPYILDPSKI